MAVDPRIPRLAELRAGQPDVFRALWPQPTEVAALARAAGAQLLTTTATCCERVGPRAEFLPEVCTETGAAFERP